MTLQLYIIRRLLLAMVYTAASMLLLVFPLLIVAGVTKLGGVSLQTVIFYLPFQVVELFPYLLPTTGLIAITWTYGGLAADNEWTAMQFSGVHPLRGVMPCLFVTTLLSLGSGALLTRVFPELRYRQRVMARAAGIEVVEGLFPGQTEIKAGGFALMGRERINDTLLDVDVIVPRSRPNLEDLVIHAERVTLGYGDEVLTLRLESARVGDGLSQSWHEQVNLSVGIGELFEPLYVDRSRIKYMDSPRLESLLRTDETGRYTREQIEFELHRRRSLAASIIVLALVAMATGLRLRSRATFFAIGVALFICCLYFFTTIRGGEVLVRSGRVGPWLGAWSSNIAFGTIGGLVLLKVIRR